MLTLWSFSPSLTMPPTENLSAMPNGEITSRAEQTSLSGERWKRHEWHVVTDLVYLSIEASQILAARIAGGARTESRAACPCQSALCSRSRPAAQCSPP